MKPYFIIRLSEDDYNKLSTKHMPRLKPYSKLETAEATKPLDEYAEVVTGATGMIQFRFTNKDQAANFCKNARKALKIQDEDNCINVRDDQKPHYIVRVSKAQYSELSDKSLLKHNMAGKYSANTNKM